LILGDV
jgi:hypothetical protein